MRRYLFPPRLGEVPEQTASVLSALGVQFDRPLVRAAVSEALLNAILYGVLEVGAAGEERDIDELMVLAREAEARAPEGAHVDVSIEVPAIDTALVRVRDDGAGFDWRAATASSGIFDGEATRGRGIAIMLSAAEVTWNDVGNEVSLRFRVDTTKGPSRSPTPAAGGKPTPKAGACSGKILVVDDVELNCMILRRDLEASGFQVATATSGASAISLMLEWTPEIVLADLHMPGMNGIDLLRRMREIGLMGRMHVIMLTATDRDADLRLDAIEMGANEFLSKGVPHRELVARIQRMLAVQRSFHALHGEREQLQRSIDAASELVRSLLPEPRIECGAAVVSSLSAPSASIGGDVIDLVHLAPGRWAALLLDVAGHGLRAALTASASRALLRERLRATLSIAAAATALHQFLLQDAELTHHHVAMTAIVVDEAQGVLEVLNAGSPPAAVWTRDGSVRLFESRSPPAGLIEDTHFTTIAMPLDDVARAVLVSDGLTEPFASTRDTLGALAACCGDADRSQAAQFPRGEIERSIARLGDDRDDASIVWIQMGACAAATAGGTHRLGRPSSADSARGQQAALKSSALVKWRRRARARRTRAARIAARSVRSGGVSARGGKSKRFFGAAADATTRKRGETRPAPAPAQTGARS